MGCGREDSRPRLIAHGSLPTARGFAYNPPAVQPFDDLQGSLQAGLLMFMVLATLGVLFSFPGRAVRERVMRALGYFLLLAVACFLMALYGALPLRQFLIASACLWGGIFVDRPRVNIAFSYLILLGGLGLMSWCSILAGGPYVDRSAWRGPEQEALDRQLATARSILLRYADTDGHDYEPELLRDSRLMDRYSGALTGIVLEGNVGRAWRLWHTWLTGLYGHLPGPRAIYYPGGRLRDGVPLMEWRDLPRTRR